MKSIFPTFFTMSFFIVSILKISAATIAHDESIDGDLSGDFTSPTVVLLVSGDNILRGSAGNNGNTGGHSSFAPNNDGDYLTLTVPIGYTITALDVSLFNSTGSAGNGSFFGYVTGVTALSSENDNDGYALFSSTRTDLFGNPPNSSMGVSEFEAGDYVFSISEINDVVVNFELTIRLEQVPEPATASLFLMGACAYILRRKRI